MSAAITFAYTYFLFYIKFSIQAEKCPLHRIFFVFWPAKAYIVCLMQNRNKLFIDVLSRLMSGLEKSKPVHQAYRSETNERVHSNDMGTEPHYHESWELKIPLKGRLHCRFEKRSLDLKPHAALLIAPLSIHYVTVPDDLRSGAVWLNCLFENGDIRLMLTEDRRISHYFLSADQKSELTTLLGRPADEFCEHIVLVLEHAKEKTGQKMAAKWLLLLFASLINAISSPPVSSPAHEIVSRAIAMLNTMSNDVTLTVGRMAKLLNISPKYLSSVFHRLTGVSPRRKLVRIRLAHAFRQLQTGRFSVKEVAAMTGWQNQFYFSNSFRRHYGVSPSEVVPLTRISHRRRETVKNPLLPQGIAAKVSARR